MGSEDSVGLGWNAGRGEFTVSCSYPLCCVYGAGSWVHGAGSGT